MGQKSFCYTEQYAHAFSLQVISLKDFSENILKSWLFYSILATTGEV